MLGTSIRSTELQSGITALNCSNCHIGRVGLSALALGVRKTGVISLDLSSNLSVHASKSTLIGVNDQVGVSISKLLSDSSTLTHLDISDNSFLTEELNEIHTACAWNSTLTSLDLSNTGMTCKTARTLAYSILGNKYGGIISSLNISQNKLDPRSIDDFATLLSHKNVGIENLDVSGNFLDDDVASKFGRSLSSSNCNLKELNLNAISGTKELNCANITCDGVRALINGSISTKKLKRLRLKGTQFAVAVQTLLLSA